MAGAKALYDLFFAPRVLAELLGNVKSKKTKGNHEGDCARPLTPLRLFFHSRFASILMKKYIPTLYSIPYNKKSWEGAYEAKTDALVKPLLAYPLTSLASLCRDE
jgi:hypothetical protein